jgi:hypothetical protein
MFYSKTHFRQLPLEIVRKIMDEQIRMEAGNEERQGARKESMSDDLWEEEGQSIVQPPAPSQVER